jgi:hypothetical protein
MTLIALLGCVQLLLVTNCAMQDSGHAFVVEVLFLGEGSGMLLQQSRQWLEAERIAFKLGMTLAPVMIAVTKLLAPSSRALPALHPISWSVALAGLIFYAIAFIAMYGVMASKEEMMPTTAN